MSLTTSHHFHFLILFIYFWLGWIFLAAQAFSSRSEKGLLSSCDVLPSHCGGVSCWGAWVLGRMDSVVVVQGLCCLSVCRIFPTSHQASVPCIGTWLLNHWTIREVSFLFSKCSLSAIFMHRTQGLDMWMLLRRPEKRRRKADCISTRWCDIIATYFMLTAGSPLVWFLQSSGASGMEAPAYWSNSDFMEFC